MYTLFVFEQEHVASIINLNVLTEKDYTKRSNIKLVNIKTKLCSWECIL